MGLLALGRCVGLFTLLVGLVLFGNEGYLRAKGALAELLLSRAFAAHLEDGRPHRPWSWADLRPIARLRFARLGVERYVLSGASGSSLAFGVGHVDGTALPNRPGHCVLAGHRDSWLRFLQDVRVGDVLTLQTREAIRRFVVRETRIVSDSDVGTLEPTTRSRLSLVTCYPFGGLRPSRLRYVVVCTPRGAGGQRDLPDPSRQAA